MIERYGLRATLPDAVDPSELMRLMARDKKAIDGLTFVLDGPEGVEVVGGVRASDAEWALDAVRESGPR